MNVFEQYRYTAFKVGRGGLMRSGARRHVVERAGSGGRVERSASRPFCGDGAVKTGEQPSLPRSVGFGPVLLPRGGMALWLNQCWRAPTRSGQIRAIGGAWPHSVSARRLPAANHVGGAASNSYRRHSPVLEEGIPTINGGRNLPDTDTHGIPVRSTNRMPVNAARSSMRGRPPFGDGV